MLINTKWLLDYLSPVEKHEELIETLTAAGLEIEEAWDLREMLRTVVIGFIREKKPLGEDAFLCQVETEPGKLHSIVCTTAFTVEEGWGVPVALPGTKLPHGVDIGVSQVRGEESSGMICGDAEMGLIARGETGLSVFHDEAMLGQPFAQVAEFDEWLADINVLPNRPDCLGMLGVAREVAAVLGLEFRYPELKAPKVTGEGEPFPVTIEVPEKCYRYIGQPITGIKVGPSPAWLRSRLQVVGKRAINNIVDITNFVLMEYGQPLHAFDMAKLAGPEIRVRNMRADETLELLDGTKLDGEIEPLVIADAKQPVALAGIMGGADSQTTQASTSILLEAACFDPVNTRKTARALKLSTDSSYRYERGTDPNFMLEQGFKRARALMCELGQGNLPVKPTETYPSKVEPVTLTLTPQRVSGYLGMDVTREKIHECLGKLGMTCEADEITAPTWRVDAVDDVVLIEDVARLIGYDEIPLEATSASATQGRTNDADQMRERLSAFLVANGFLETRHAPLVDASMLNLFQSDSQAQIELENPLRSDMSVLRDSLIPSLLQTCERNARRGETSFRFFEIDRRFVKNPTGDGHDINEYWTLGAVVGGTLFDAAWESRKTDIEFPHAKGLLEQLLANLGMTERFQMQRGPVPRGFNPEQTGIIQLGETPIGYLGAVDPKKANLDSRVRAQLFAFEVDIAKLVTAYVGNRPFAGLSRQQGTSRDLSLLVDKTVTYRTLEDTIRSSFAQAISGWPITPMLEEVVCVDEYSGDNIETGKKSLTLRFTFRDETRALTSEEANQISEAVLASLTSEHQVRLRG